MELATKREQTSSVIPRHQRPKRNARPGIVSFLDAVREVKDLAIAISLDFKWEERCAAVAKKSRHELLTLKPALSFREQVFTPLKRTSSETSSGILPAGLKRKPVALNRISG